MLASLPAGLALGAAVWLVAPSRGLSNQVAALDVRLAGIHAHSPSRPPGTANAALTAIGSPLFALTTGAHAVAEVALKLEGLVRTPGRTAALISINGSPSDWLALGETRDGVTLQDVSAAKVVVDTPTGVRDVELGASPQTVVTAVSPAPTGPSTIPPGFRQPPPPASAPHGGA